MCVLQVLHKIAPYIFIFESYMYDTCIKVLHVVQPPICLHSFTRERRRRTTCPRDLCFGSLPLVFSTLCSPLCSTNLPERQTCWRMCPGWNNIYSHWGLFSFSCESAPVQHCTTEISQTMHIVRVKTHVEKQDTPHKQQSASPANVMLLVKITHVKCAVKRPNTSIHNSTNQKKNSYHVAFICVATSYFFSSSVSGRITSLLSTGSFHSSPLASANFLAAACLACTANCSAFSWAKGYKIFFDQSM